MAEEPPAWRRLVMLWLTPTVIIGLLLGIGKGIWFESNLATSVTTLQRTAETNHSAVATEQKETTARLDKELDAIRAAIIQQQKESRADRIDDEHENQALAQTLLQIHGQTTFMLVNTPTPKEKP